jgi:hypothetical protein
MTVQEQAMKDAIDDMSKAPRRLERFPASAPFTPPIAPVHVSVALHVIRLNMRHVEKDCTPVENGMFDQLYKEACLVVKEYLRAEAKLLTEQEAEDVPENTKSAEAPTLDRRRFVPGNPQPKRDMWGQVGGPNPPPPVSPAAG